jgi:hypothetical protein
VWGIRYPPRVLAGHYSAAFIAKAADPSVPLWVLALAVQAVDIVWGLFVLTGVEHLRIDPSLPSNPLDLYDMPYTHSLLGTLVWAGLAFAISLRWLGRARSAVVVAAAVASHWLLDWLVHRPDLTLYGVPPKLGLGLWNHPLPALALELALLAGSAWLCVRMNRLTGRALTRVLVFTGALIALQLALTASAPAFGPAGIAATGLLLYAAVAWGAARTEQARVG